MGGGKREREREREKEIADFAVYIHAQPKYTHISTTHPKRPLGLDNGGTLLAEPSHLIQLYH